MRKAGSTIWNAVGKATMNPVRTSIQKTTGVRSTGARIARPSVPRGSMRIPASIPVSIRASTGTDERRLDTDAEGRPGSGGHSTAVPPAGSGTAGRTRRRSTA